MTPWPRAHARGFYFGTCVLTSRPLFAEALGTFALTFAGTSAIVVNDLTAGAVSHVGVALTFGLIVFAMICALGHVSGCHINPAVTVGLCVARRFPVNKVLPYVLCQCVGAIAASLAVKLLFPEHPNLGATLPRGSHLQSWMLEVILTGILMYVILGVTSVREMQTVAPLAIGATVALDALYGGPISGASMNPARSLGPALISGQLSALWIYVTAPLVGAVLAVAAFTIIQGVNAPAEPMP